MAEISNTDNTKGWWGRGATGMPLLCCWECKPVQPLWKIIWWFLTNSNIILTSYIAVTVLGIYLSEFKTSGSHRDLLTNVHSSFIHNCQNLKAIEMTFSRLVDKLWYTRTMGNSALKKMSYQALKRHGGNLNECSWVSEASLKRLHAVWFRLCGILEKAKLWRQ